LTQRKREGGGKASIWRSYLSIKPNLFFKDKPKRKGRRKREEDLRPGERKKKTQHRFCGGGKREKTILKFYLKRNNTLRCTREKEKKNPSSTRRKGSIALKKNIRVGRNKNIGNRTCKLVSL